MAMYDDNEKATAAPKKVSELDRLADQLAKQHQLLIELESRLEPVSHRTPQETAETTELFHIETLVNYVISNNIRIERIINEIVL